ncbi:hypothetical protein [Pontibacter harenae]|uniref:hypothetical protein n=1 Tax=Pontibacter harenae TaxID=2894083 RepID=UPI001E572E4D|nr:hypothetical protein [Pontibacter harenae]MCC9168390.1 hypothetical protein [Pontibacter harenae]
MTNKTHTIVLDHDGVLYKLFKLMYGRDGSVMLISPYHPSKEAIVGLSTINYSLQEKDISIEEAIDVASVKDDKKRLKLTHHASGLIHISGEGITSGINENGRLKGIGVQSWPLEYPVTGPAFGITIYGFEHFDIENNIKSDFHVFSTNACERLDNYKALVIEGYCFPAHYRRFVRTDNNGQKIIHLTHPTGMVIPLRVAFPPQKCKCQSFFGIELYFDEGHPDEQHMPSYFLSSSTGNIRVNDKNEHFGDSIFCMFPRQSLPVKRSLNRFI